MSTARLVACPACARHVRVTEPSCPFCNGAIDASRTGAERFAPAARVSRSILYAYGIGALALAAGCSSSSSQTVVLYGAPPSSEVDEHGTCDGITLGDGCTGDVYFVTDGCPLEGGDAGYIVCEDGTWEAFAENPADDGFTEIHPDGVELRDSGAD